MGRWSVIPRLPSLTIGVRRAAKASVLVSAAVYVCACSEPRSTSPDGTVGADLVTAAVASQLDASGHFRLPRVSPGRSGELTASRAELLGTAFLHQLGPMIQGSLEGDHGGPINVKALSVCGRTLYASTAYEPVDSQVSANAMGRVYERIFGPWWLVTFCDRGGELQVGLAVSAYATDLRIEADGQLNLPLIGGEWFHWEGIPKAAAGEWPASPEHAVQMAAKLTGRRVATLPEFIAPGITGGSPFHGHWRMGLDGSAEYRRVDTGAQVRAEDSYIGNAPGAIAPAAFLPTPEQPEGKVFRYRTNAVIGAPAQPPEYAASYVRRRSDVPVDFVPVTRPTK